MEDINIVINISIICVSVFVYFLPSVPIYKCRNLEYNIILTADQIEAT